MFKIPHHLQSNPEIVEAWNNTQKQLYADKKEYLANKGWILFAEESKFPNAYYKHPENNDVHAYIRNNRISYVYVHSSELPSGEIEDDVVEFPECLLDLVLTLETKQSTERS